MCQGSAADPGSTPELGPFAACHSPSLSLFPVISSAVLSIRPKKAPSFSLSISLSVTLINDHD